VICLILVSQSVLADTIYLRDGSQVSGKIVLQSNTAVMMQTSTGKWTYERANIIRIDYGPAASAPPAQQTAVATSAALPPTPTVLQGAPAESQGIELGASFGLFFIADVELATLGGFASAELSDGIALKVAYSHAGVDFLGLELLGIDFLEASLLFDVAPGSPVGAYVQGGATYILMTDNLQGESIGGALFLAGAGIRLSLSDFLVLRAGYVGRFKYGVMHSAVAEVSVRF